MKICAKHILLIAALSQTLGACKQGANDSDLQTFTTAGALKTLTIESLRSGFPEIFSRLQNPDLASKDGENIIGIAMGAGSVPPEFAEKPSGRSEEGEYFKSWGTAYINCRSIPCRQEGGSSTGWGLTPPGSIDPKTQNAAIYLAMAQILGEAGSPTGKTTPYTHDVSLGVYDSVKSDLAGQSQSQSQVVILQRKSKLNASGDTSEKTFYIASNGQLIGVQTIDSAIMYKKLSPGIQTAESIAASRQRIDKGPTSEIQFIRQ